MNLRDKAETSLNEARVALAEVTAEYEARLSDLSDAASADDITAVTSEYAPKLEGAEGRVKDAQDLFDRMDALARAREATKSLIPAADTQVREAPVYSGDNPHGASFFSDMYRYVQRGDRQALDRLERNSNMTLDELEKRGTPFTDAEGRAMSSTTGAGGDFLPPLYFGDLYAEFKRARRVTSNLVRNMPLAAKGNTITIPRITAGTSTAAQQDNQNVSTTDATTAILSVPVCTVAGYNDLSRQIVERSEPGLDMLILEDLLKDYNKRVNSYVVNGSNSGGQPLGLLNQSGTNAVTYTSGSPTVYGLYPKIQDAIRQITENVFEETASLVMTARRWAWMAASIDGSNRPLVVPNGQGPYNALGLQNSANASHLDNMTPVGWVAGIPCFVDETIPKTLGSGTNQDPIIAAAWNEHILWEDPAGPRQFQFEGVTSQTAAIRVQVFGYMAFTAGRYPAATSVINGTGLAAPTF